MASVRILLIQSAMLCSFAGAANAAEKVVIVGGRDGSGQNFSWTVRNQASSPIVWIEFPHYHADLFTPPAGWKQECTNLNVIGSDDKPGVCRGISESASEGIPPGSSAQFSMRLSRSSANKGSGTVQVKFADGTTASVSGVAVPIAPSVWDHLLPPLAMGAIFVAAIVIHRKSRKSPGSASTPTESN